MKKITPLILFTAILTNISMYANNLSDCRDIADDRQRLDCYDHLKIDSKHVLSKEIMPELMESQKSEKVPLEKNIQPPAKPIPKDTENKDSNENSFGLKKDELSVGVNTTILGEFSGWDKNTVFKLTNGQVWKVSDSGTRAVYRRTTINPNVKISKGFFGSYKLNVEGVNSSVKVKRIK